MPEVHINVFKHGDFKLPSKKTMKKWIEKAAEHDTELNILFVGKDEGRELNSHFRHKDYATNVLTFDYQHEPVAVADFFQGAFGSLTYSRYSSCSRLRSHDR